LPRYSIRQEARRKVPDLCLQKDALGAVLFSLFPRCCGPQVASSGKNVHCELVCGSLPTANAAA
jgi:hypothetical protein